MSSIRPNEMRKTILLYVMKNGGMCPMCLNHEAVQYHEVITRARTAKNPAARELSYQKEICVYLCQRCHDNASTLTEKILDFNIKLYGFDRVLAALKSVCEYAVYEIGYVEGLSNEER